MHSARLISSIIASVVAAPALAQHDGLPSDPVTDCAIIEAHGQMLEIFQLTPNCVINWDRFSIDFEHIVHFIQQQGSWRVLNRVTGAEFSRISGSMTADGLVYIVNPAGIFFDGTAVVDVGGIYAAAGDLTDSNFMMGVDRFENLSGAVTNRGHLSGNLVHLVGEMVANHGTIDAAGGVARWIGADVIVSTSAGPLVRFKTCTKNARSKEIRRYPARDKSVRPDWMSRSEWVGEFI